MNQGELREKLADVQHGIWAHWMRYMFDCGTHWPDGGWTMPGHKSERWQRQMETPYSELTDKERMSDRDQADKVLEVIAPVLAENEQLNAQVDAVADYAAYAHGQWSDSSWPLPFIEWYIFRQRTQQPR